MTASLYIFVLSSVYLVEYTLHQNLMIEIYTRNFDLHITVPSPNLAFLCRNLDYKPYSINQPIANTVCFRNPNKHNRGFCNTSLQSPYVYSGYLFYTVTASGHIIPYQYYTICDINGTKKIEGLKNI